MKQIRETSDFVCQKLISKLPITDGIRLLEPSCGDGKILDYLFSNYSFKGVKVTGIELNKERLEKAINLCLTGKEDQFCKNDFNFYQADFLTLENPFSKYLYDIVIACPPFKNNIDLEHIKKMYSLLKNKGMMSTLTSPYWITNNENHQVEFRSWLKDKDYQLEILPDNSFMEKGKSIPTAILTITNRKKKS